MSSTPEALGSMSFATQPSSSAPPPPPRRFDSVSLGRYGSSSSSFVQKARSVERLGSELAFATHSFFREHGFRNIRTPIITTQDFFGRKAFLTVSGELELEPPVCALSDVYTFGPTIRAEQSHTSNHLAEFWMVEAEFACADLQADMDCAEEYVKYMCNWLLEKSYHDLEIMARVFDESCIDRLKSVAKTPFARITYTEAIKLLEYAVSVGRKFDKNVKWGIKLASEHERYLSEVLFKKPTFVYNYPKEIKPFCTRVNDDEKTVAAMDLLVPKIGELISGCQREERLDVIVKRMEEMGVPIEPYEWYIDLRRYGTVKHCGFELGFERMIMFATGIDNIKDVNPFPRYPGSKAGSKAKQGKLRLAVLFSILILLVVFLIFCLGFVIGQVFPALKLSELALPGRDDL